MSALAIVVWCLAGTLIGALVSLFPSLHIYNVAGLALLLWETTSRLIPAAAVGPFFISLVVAFAFINTIPMTLIGAPDESATVTILPGTKYMMSGRGYEAAMVTGIGCLAGVGLLAALTPFYFDVLPVLNKILSPHMHWILGLVMVYMLMSEWPKGSGRGATVWQRFRDSWQNLFAGQATFFLAALLGLIMTSKSIITHEMGFQNILPIFVGLFAVPSIIQNLLSRERIPEQHVGDRVELHWRDVGKGAFQGTIAGVLAAYLPAVTAGIGGIIAGHATAQRGDRIFLLSGGVSKVLYYVGAFLMLFIVTPFSPGGLGKGGLNMILKPVFSPEPGQYPVILFSVVLSGCVSFLLLDLLCRPVIALLRRVDYHRIYWVMLVVVIAFIFALTGFPGLLVLAVSTCIGSIPVFFHARRSNCMAVLLVPIALNMAGYGEAVLRVLGLE